MARRVFETIRCPNCGMLSQVHFRAADTVGGVCLKCQRVVVWHRPVDMATPIPVVALPKGALIF